jgi:multiple sugar transport system ATP-binding protein
MQVRYEHVTKHFGSVVALQDLNLTVEDGEFLVLLGPSGCGKTTALRILAGLEKPTAGQVWIGDRVVTRLEPRDRDVAMVFQSYALYPHLTVAQNIAYPLKVRKVPAEEKQQRVREVAERLGIGQLLDRRPRQLSGGQRQRVALARALVREPNVFLMDEPLSNLDAKLRVQMRGELKHLQKSLGITTLYVTHDQAEAMTMADRVAILNDGVLQQVDDPQVVYARPVNTFVAGFVGSPAMNMLEVQGDHDGYIFRSRDLSWPIAEPVRTVVRDHPHGRLILGVRPEDVSLEAGDRDYLQVSVYAVEPMGNETLVMLKVGDSFIMARTGPDFRASIGDTRPIRFNDRKIHLFDAGTGLRLKGI